MQYTTGETKLYRKEAKDCKYAGKTSPGATHQIDPFADVSVVANDKGEWSYIIVRGEVECKDGGNELCISQKCPNYEGKTT